MPPAVSIILPTFNRAWILKEALASIQQQTCSDYELIVVDDGSTDDTPQLLARADMPLKVVRQPNSGVSAARNAGIRVSRGRFLALLDSDDLWRPRKIERQLAFFAQHPEAMICQCEEIWIRRGVRVNPKNRHRKPSGWIFEPSLALCLVSPSAVMMRRALLDAVGVFDETLPACEDYDLWLRISARYPVHLLEFSDTIKRGGHADQLSRAPGLDRYRIQSLDKIIASGVLSPSQKAAAVAMLHQKAAIYAGGCRKRGRLDEAARVAAIAARY